MRTIFGPGLRYVALASVFVSASAAQGQTTLRWKFQSGETLKYTISQKTTVKRSLNNQSFESSMTQVYDTTWKITEASNGKASISESFDRIRTTVEIPTGKVEYDSKDGEVPAGKFGPEFGPLLSALAGAEVTFKIDDKGEVTDVTLPEKLVTAFQGMKSAGGMSEEAFKKLIRDSAFSVPAEPVQSSKSWTKQSEQKTPPTGSTVVTNTYTYKGKESKDGKELDRIDVVVAVELKADPQSPIQVKVKSQDAKGTVYFDNNKGRLSELNVVQKVEIQVSLGAQQSSQTSDSTMSVKLVE